MNRMITPKEYRYILGDFVRSGIHIKYAKACYDGTPVTTMIDGKEFTTYPEYRTIYFPYISGRQYQIYKEYHFVASENDSMEYRILGESEAGEIGEYEIEDFKDWGFFCEAFDVKDSDFQNDMNYCYAFILDYNVRFLDLPLKSSDIIDNDMCDDAELLEDLRYMSIDLGELSTSSKPNMITADIQKNHIFEIYENYNKQNPLYPLSMSLEWFYLLTGQRMHVDTIFKSISPTNIIYQDDLMTNYVVDYFPFISEDEAINTFKQIRDKYAHRDQIRENEWYAHTTVLLERILKMDGIEHISKKIKKVRAFCNNQGVNLYETSSNNVPHFEDILSEYKKSVEKIYNALIEGNYLDEETTLSDFRYYLTGELESDIQGKIFWKKTIVEFVEFLAYISGDKGEWTIASQIVVDKKGKSPTAGTLRQSMNQSSGAHRETFAKIF